MNPFTSQTYIRLIAQWLPLSQDDIDLIGLAMVHRVTHAALRHFHISIPFRLDPINVVAMTDYWIPITMALNRCVCIRDLARSQVSNISLFSTGI